MKVQLKNRHASLTLHPSRGGLLTDLFLEDGRGEPVDIFWKSANILEEASGWPMGGMPFLFPFGGRVCYQDQPLRYSLGDGRVFPMPLHGFGYGLPWQVEASGVQTGGGGEDPRGGAGGRAADLSGSAGSYPSQLTLVLEDSPTTHVLYPFRFKVSLTYALEQHKLTVSGRIDCLGSVADPEASSAQKNLQDQGASGEGMPVAPGFHPFFKVPLRTGGRWSECFLESRAETLVRVTPQGLAGKAVALEPHQRPHPLQGPEFQNSILTDLQDTSCSLVDRDHRMALEIKWSSQDPFKHLVLWTQASDQTPAFFCVEPWTALPDALAPGHGAIWLQKGQSLDFGVGIRLRDQRR